MKKLAIIVCLSIALTGLIISSSIAKDDAPIVVQVNNDSTNPVPVTGLLQVQSIDKPAFEPFQYHFHIAFNTTQGSNGFSFPIPSGKRLVIEFVSATIGLNIGSIVDSAVKTTVNGITANHHMEFIQNAAAWGYPQSYTISKSMRVYADPDTTVMMYVVDNLTGAGEMTAAISGYFVDVLP